MDEMNITYAKYIEKDGAIAGIEADIDGKRLYVPRSLGNRHYAEIKRQVAAGTLTIQDAD